ncbi:17406_t:CDS:2, partial [Gigaspora rosea]
TQECIAYDGGWPSGQCGDDLLYLNHRPKTASGNLIAIYHSVFETFVEDCQTVVSTDEIYQFVLGLTEEMWTYRGNVKPMKMHEQIRIKQPFNQRPARYINRVPSELWSLEGFCSCIIFCGGEPKEQLFYFFYRTLESVIKDKNGAATYDKAQKLLSNKKSDQKKVSKMGKEYGAQVSNTKENDKRSPETNVVSPDSITRSEAYKSVEFEPILAKDLLHSVKPSKIPEPVKEYLDKNSMPNKMSTEEEVQRWFNGYMPDISIVSKEDAADRALVPKYVYTVLELKKPKSTSGLADDDKGQLLDYVRVLLQQQPSRQVFAAFLSDAISIAAASSTNMTTRYCIKFLSTDASNLYGTSSISEMAAQPRNTDIFNNNEWSAMSTTTIHTTQQ